MLKIQGILVPIATPFDHRGEVYKVKLASNIERLNAINLAGYVVGDELLTAEEKPLVWELAAKAAQSGKLLGAVTSAPSVRETVALTNRAAELGYHFAMVHAAGATKALYYEAVADGAKIPVIVEADFGTTHPNILRPELTTHAASLFTDLKAGSKGGVIAIANAIPYSIQLIWEAYRQREEEAGFDWQERISALAQVVGKYGTPGLKWAMDLNSYYGGAPRLPHTTVNDEAKAEIAAAIKDLKS